MLEMFEAFMLLIITITWLPVAIVGGIVAYKKGDYFSRGFVMIAICWIFGLIYLIKAPHSKAKEEDHNDDCYNWHSHTAAGLFWICAFGILYILIRTIIKF